MLYVSAAFVVFPFARSVVYEELTDLSSLPAWSKSLVSITPMVVMREGLRFRIANRLCGSLNTTTVAVERLLENEYVELTSKSGLISFRALFNFVENSPVETEVICTLRFEFKGFIFNAARPVIESMAKMLCQRNLLELRSYIIQSRYKSSAMIARLDNRSQ